MRSRTETSNPARRVILTGTKRLWVKVVRNSWVLNLPDNELGRTSIKGDSEIVGRSKSRISIHQQGNMWAGAVKGAWFGSVWSLRKQSWLKI